MPGLDLDIGIEIRVTFCRGERPVHRFVAQIEHERSVVPLLQKPNRIISKVIGHIGVRLDGLPVNIELILVISALPGKAHPMFESGSGRILPGHVPFPNERRFVAGFLQELRECRDGGIWVNPVISKDFVGVRITASQETSPRRAAQRRCHKRVLEYDALFGQAIHVRCFQPGMARTTHGVITLVIRQDKDDVGPL